MARSRRRGFSVFLRSFNLLSHVFSCHTSQQRLHILTRAVAFGVVASSDKLRFGSVHNAIALDAAQAKLLAVLNQLRAKPNLKRAYTVENHALRVLKMNLHLA